LWFATRQEAVDAWNTRADDAEAETARAEASVSLKLISILVDTIPLRDVLHATGTFGDMVTYFKAALAERETLKQELKAARGWME